mmetsp:Transcript_63634/g.99092  ORF Transcript_63634/g.99092 Transcript_63634/m.99092 type:complete len:228 (-) Transcript_63634:2609-3292(-)
MLTLRSVRKRNFCGSSGEEALNKFFKFRDASARRTSAASCPETRQLLWELGTHAVLNHNSMEAWPRCNAATTSAASNKGERQTKSMLASKTCFCSNDIESVKSSSGSKVTGLWTQPQPPATCIVWLSGKRQNRKKIPRPAPCDGDGIAQPSRQLAKRFLKANACKATARTLTSRRTDPGEGTTAAGPDTSAAISFGIGDRRQVVKLLVKTDDHGNAGVNWLWGDCLL